MLGPKHLYRMFVRPPVAERLSGLCFYLRVGAKPLPHKPFNFRGLRSAYGTP